MAYFDLFKHEIVHFLLTLLAAGTTLIFLPKKKKYYRKLTIVIMLGAFLGEFLLDTDHLFDYFLAYGLHFRLDYFFKGYMFDKLSKTFVIFHAWEWIAVLGTIICLTKNIIFRYFLIALTLGLLFHLVYDTVYNHVYFLGYSIIYRFIHSFDAKYIALPD